jgi:hypothetical protein
MNEEAHFFGHLSVPLLTGELERNAHIGILMVLIAGYDI